MAGMIFLNYRRQDDPGFTTALFGQLEIAFHADSLFMDVEGYIRPGDDWVDVLGASVESCDVMLAVIGSRWLTLFHRAKNTRHDFVEYEIRTALQRGKRVIPVLVGGADLPASEDLPQSIRSLARKNAVVLRPDRFKSDCTGLITSLRTILNEVAEQRERSARHRRQADQNPQKGESKEAERRTSTERESRNGAAKGAGEEQTQRGPEIASWNYVRQSNDVGDVRNHLARFPRGETEQYALARLEALTWASLEDQPTEEALRRFIEQFPKGRFRAEAESKLEAGFSPILWKKSDAPSSGRKDIAPVSRRTTKSNPRAREILKFVIASIFLLSSIALATSTLFWLTSSRDGDGVARTDLLAVEPETAVAQVVTSDPGESGFLFAPEVAPAPRRTPTRPAVYTAPPPGGAL